MTHLDGNALAGPLADLLGGDPTSLIARCASCGTENMVAGLVVWREPQGTAIARCPHCTAVVFCLRDDEIDLGGLRTLRSADAAPRPADGPPDRT